MQKMTTTIFHSKIKWIIIHTENTFLNGSFWRKLVYSKSLSVLKALYTHFTFYCENEAYMRDKHIQIRVVCWKNRWWVIQNYVCIYFTYATFSQQYVELFMPHMVQNERLLSSQILTFTCSVPLNFFRSAVNNTWKHKMALLTYKHTQDVYLKHVHTQWRIYPTLLGTIHWQSLGRFRNIERQVGIHM